MKTRREVSSLQMLAIAVLIGTGPFSLSSAFAAEEGREEPDVYKEVDGDPVYRVVPPGKIPAIDEPTFVSGDDADAQMRAKEPVIGVVIDGSARAYSLWQLDAHEIVNDTVSGVEFAVTW